MAASIQLLNDGELSILLRAEAALALGRVRLFPPCGRRGAVVADGGRERRDLHATS